MTPKTTESEHGERVKTQQMFERANRTRETQEIRLEATKPLRAEHTDFSKRPSLRFLLRHELSDGFASAIVRGGETGDNTAQ